MEEGLAKNILVGVREWTNAKLSNRLKVVRLTRAQYQALISTGEIDDYTIYIISLTATFVNWDSSVLYTTAIAYGNTPVYVGPTPTRPESSQTIYTFTGWNPTLGPITQDTTFTAQYSEQHYYVIHAESDGQTDAYFEYNGELVTDIYVNGGSSVTFTFAGLPEPGYAPDYWENNATGNTYQNSETLSFTNWDYGNVTFILHSRKAEQVTISFAPIGYKEFIDGDPSYGYIKSINEGYDHGDPYVEYEGSTETTITGYKGDAVSFVPMCNPDGESELYSWSDGLVDGEENTVILTANKTYYARFIPQGAHIATVQPNNSEYGQVSIYEDYFESGDVERIVPVEGCQIWPIARENSGYDFVEWEPWLENCSLQSIEIDEDTVYTAIFRHSGGTPTTSTLIFNSACGGEGITDDGTKWVVTSDAAESTYDSTKGIHYGTNSVKVQYINLIQDTVLSGPITQVVVNASTGSGVTATLSVTVGGVAFGTTQSLTQTATNYTFTGQATGVVEVIIQKPQQAAKALYCKSIAVTYLAQ